MVTVVARLTRLIGVEVLRREGYVRAVVPVILFAYLPSYTLEGDSSTGYSATVKASAFDVGRARWSLKSICNRSQ